MAQIFHPSTNAIARASIIALVLGVGGAGLGAWEWQHAPAVTGAGLVRDQPVPFSHEHHARGLGIDCRYCHTSVEDSQFAGIPPTETCMTCHSQIWTNAAVLEPVRQSWRTNEPLAWTRVHDLPDFVYFNHGVHVAKGVGCSTCHGRVDRMPLTWQAAPLQMSWCLDCHRAPERFLRPRDEVFNMAYVPPPNQAEIGKQLVETYGVRTGQLSNCSICHR